MWAAPRRAARARPISTGRSRYSKTRLKRAIEATHEAPTLSRPMIGRKMPDCSVVKAMIVPIVMPPLVAGKPAAR